MINSELDSCGFGLLVQTKGDKSHSLIEKALLALTRLTHRGAIGEDGISGDGCGLMTEIDYHYFRSLANENSLTLEDNFAIGMCQLNPKEILNNQKSFERRLIEQGFEIAGWREVPVNGVVCGKQAERSMPAHQQVFLHLPKKQSQTVIEKKLYIAKKLITEDLIEDPYFHISSLSSKTIVYKALVLPVHLEAFFPDLSNTNFQVRMALFHQRFSTNTLSSWRLIQPFATLAHNGEINTIQGNRHAALGQSQLLIRDHFPELKSLKTLVCQQGSDSMSLDNQLESYIHAGMTSYEACRLLIPSAWQNAKDLSPNVRAYFDYHSHLAPPWDGPAGIVFCDGIYAGCLLDKNGFRPTRFKQSLSGLVVIGSETGLIDMDESETLIKGRMKPGQLWCIKLDTGKIITSPQLEEELSIKFPYMEWLTENKRLFPTMSHSTEQESEITMSKAKLHEDCLQFNISREELQQVIRHMAETGIESTSSMGDDTPLAPLSDQPRNFFDFFRQQFAQVTNPPMDSLREKSIMSLSTTLGPRGQLLQRTPELARKLVLQSPLLTPSIVQAIQSNSIEFFPCTSISLNYSKRSLLRNALEKLCKKAKKAIKNGAKILIFSDSNTAINEPCIHPALAVGAISHYLIDSHLRDQVSLIFESGWLRDAHHIAVMLAYGADAIYPTLAYQLVEGLAIENKRDSKQDINNYIQAVNKGLLKIISKMGISTLDGYRGAQLFNVLGLKEDIIDRCFSQSAFSLSKLDFVSLDKQYKATLCKEKKMGSGGLFKYQPEGEYHDYNPQVVTELLNAVKTNDQQLFAQFNESVTARGKRMVRDYLELNYIKPTLLLEQVQAAEQILPHFEAAAMSLGALGPEAHEAIAVAMNTLGGRSNSGEGGEASYRHNSSKRSKIKQIASGRFGVTAEYLVNAEVLQIKIAQGAKPGEGGQLAGVKVNELIASLRHCEPGTTLISPPPHHDIYSIEDLAQLIFDLKEINPKALVSVKLVSAPGVGTIAAGVVKAYADIITLSGYDGGTGASPLSSIKYTGFPWELGLLETQQILLANNLRHRVSLQVDGGFKTGLDVIKAALLGAESYGFGTAPMIALGCKYLRICHLNNCATGIATQDLQLREQFYQGSPERVINYFRWVAEDVRKYLALLGFNRLEDIIGRIELLSQLDNELDFGFASYKKQNLIKEEDRKKLFTNQANKPFDQGELAAEIQRIVIPELNKTKQITAHFSIKNHNRSIGARLSGEIIRHFKGPNAPEDLIRLSFTGIAGQSFGAWNVKGLKLELCGEANDYLGKGMSGGKIIVYPPENSPPEAQSAIIAGNTCLYGATGGRCYIQGTAGERFAVRNSGAIAVVEGIGEHGCEYMTAGTVVILGETGTNFAAGMTGGSAFVFDPLDQQPAKTNLESVKLYRMQGTEFADFRQQLKLLLTDYHTETNSPVAAKILKKFSQEIDNIWLILPAEVKPTVRISLGEKHERN